MSLTQIARSCARLAVRGNGIRVITAQPQMRLLHRLAVPAMCNGVTQVSEWWSGTIFVFQKYYGTVIGIPYIIPNLTFELKKFKA